MVMMWQICWVLLCLLGATTGLQHLQEPQVMGPEDRWWNSQFHPNITLVAICTQLPPLLRAWQVQLHPLPSAQWVRGCITLVVGSMVWCLVNTEYPPRYTLSTTCHTMYPSHILQIPPSVRYLKLYSLLLLLFIILPWMHRIHSVSEWSKLTPW